MARAAPQRGGPGRTEGGYSFTEHGEKRRSLPIGEGRKLRACVPPPLAPVPQPKLTAPAPGAPGAAGLGGSFLPSPEQGRGAARSCRQSPLTHRGGGWPPSHCQSPWLHQGWQRGGGAGLGLTTLGVKKIKKLKHRVTQTLAPLGVQETESNPCFLILGQAMSAPTPTLCVLCTCTLSGSGPLLVTGAQS